MCLFLVSLVNKLTWFLEEEKKINFSFWRLRLCPPACVHRAREEMLCHCWHCVYVVVEENTFTSRLIQLFCELIVQNHDAEGRNHFRTVRKVPDEDIKMIFERTKNKEEGVKLLCSMCNTNMKNKGTKTWIFLVFFLLLLNKRLPVL